jgi:NAD(P)-dependent dehydrogenase (short-subunit alcohol dehydrogenase family)
MHSKAKFVLITGSTDGVGRLVARRLADQGARILIHGRDYHRGKQLLEQIQVDGRGSAVFLPADRRTIVVDTEKWAKVVQFSGAHAN